MKRAAGLLLLIAGVWVAAAYRTGNGRVGQAFYTIGETPRNMGEVVIGCESIYTFRIGNVTSPDGYSVTVVFNFTPDPRNPAFLISPLGPISVPPNSTRDVTVIFRPSSSGPTTATFGYTVSNGQTTVPSGFIVGGTGARVIVQPASLDFGRVQVGAIRDLPFTITTDFPINATFLAQRYGGTLPDPDYQVLTDASGNPFVRFSPTTPGLHRDTLRITGIRREISEQRFPGVTYQSCPFTVSLAVSGDSSQTPVPTLSPSSLSFDNVLCATAAPAQTVTITNPSSTALARGGFTVSPQSAAAALSISPGAGFILPANGSLSFSIGYTPRDANAYQATIQFFAVTPDNVTAQPPPLSVRATACQPVALSFDPNRLDFGDVNVGTTVRRAVSISTNSATALQVSVSLAAPFTASPSSFSVSRTTSQTVEFAFFPAGATTFNANATLAATGLTPSPVLALTGRGVSAALTYRYTAGQASNTINPGGEVVAPNTEIRQTSQVQFLIVNGGAAPGTIGSIAITPANSAFSLVNPPALPATVPANGQLGLTVAFRPTTPSRVTATLTVGGQAFSLRGDGVLAAIPPVSVGVAAATIDVRQTPQPTVTVILARAYTEDLTGQLTLEFQPETGLPDDPMVNFTAGGRTINFRIPANSTQALFGNNQSTSFLAGTTAGAISFRVSSLTALSQNVLATPNPAATTRVTQIAPVIRTDPTCQRQGTNLNVFVVGYSTPRRITGVNLRVTPAPGAVANFTPPTPDPFAPEFTNWYNQDRSFGTQFTLTIPLQVSGDINAIGSISVSLVNGSGTSDQKDIPLSRCQ